MTDIRDLNTRLLIACTAEKPDLELIDELLKKGAQPLGMSKRDETVYEEILFHYIDCARENDDDSAFAEITALFLENGLNVSNPPSAYKKVLESFFWCYAFYSGETAVKTMRLFLENGLDADLAGKFWSHMLTDIHFAGFNMKRAYDTEAVTESFRMLLLIAAYPHILLEDKYLQGEVWLSENGYDYTNFRNIENYSFSYDYTYCRKGKTPERAIVSVSEKESGNNVWTFGFEISPHEINGGKVCV